MKKHPLIHIAAGALVLLLACDVPAEWVEVLYRLPTLTPSASVTPGSTLYVETTGDDANDCATPAAACLTINAAVDKARDGALIRIGPGLFVERDTSSDAGLAVVNKSVTLRGTPGTGEPATTISGGDVRDALYVSGPVRVSVEEVFITGGGGGRGYGLYVGGNDHPSVTVRNSRIRYNAAAGVRILGNGTVLLDGVRVRGNRGGAISNFGGTVAVQLSTIFENSGALPTIDNQNPGSITIRDSSIVDNVSGSVGSGIANWQGAEAIILRSAVARNSLAADSDANDFAVYNLGTLTLTNTTVSSNSGVGVASLGDINILYSTIASNGGNGLFANANREVAVRLENSLLENNGAQDCYFQLLAAITFRRSGRLLSDGSCTAGGGYFFRPPEGDMLLGPLADNGGPSPTHALLEGNIGIDSAEGPCIGVDQRSIPRPAGAACDVGAYEADAPMTAALPSPTALALLLTPTVTPPLSPDVPDAPTITFTTDANCRFGPSTLYPSVGHFLEGEQALIEGRSDPAGWYWVIHKDGKTHCFVAGSTGTITGNTQDLMVIPAPPLPVKAPGYLNVSNQSCSANGYLVSLDWENVGGELGYRIYRDGALIATLGPDATSYVDAPPDFAGHTYRVESFNAGSAASSPSMPSSGCQT